MEGNSQDAIAGAVRTISAIFGQNLMAGFWAFGGAVMRGNAEWRDPKTGRFSISRFFAAIFTALTIGELVIGGGSASGVSPAIYGPLACVMGYMGPAATIAFVNRFLPTKKESPKDDTSDK